MSGDIEGRWFPTPGGASIYLRGTPAMLDEVRVLPLPASRPRCSRSNPCPARDPLHMALWGECFHEADDNRTTHTFAGTPWQAEAWESWLSMSRRRPSTRPARPTLGGWVLGVVLFIHYRRWCRARRSR